MKQKIFRHDRRSFSSLSSLCRVDRLVLEHVSRYRVTTRRGWRGAWELREFDDEVIARSVRRLVATGILRKRSLYGSLHAFELDVTGALLLSLPKERALPFSNVALFRAYAQLLYATTGKRQLVLADDNLRFSDGRETLKGNDSQSKRSSAWGFFFDPENSDQWSQLLVDRSCTTNTKRIALRAKDAALRLARNPQWKAKLEGGALSVWVITPTALRANRIHTRLKRYHGDIPIPVNMMVAPGLLPLMSSPTEP